jgi:hypothetical protein
VLPDHFVRGFASRRHLIPSPLFSPPSRPSPQKHWIPRHFFFLLRNKLKGQTQFWEATVSEVLAFMKSVFLAVVKVYGPVFWIVESYRFIGG